jgi:hypothetical protein
MVQEQLYELMAKAQPNASDRQRAHMRKAARILAGVQSRALSEQGALIPPGKKSVAEIEALMTEEEKALLVDSDNDEPSQQPCPLPKTTYLCYACDKPAKQLCSGCTLVHFCSRDCQKACWKTHKKECKNSGKLLRIVSGAENQNDGGNVQGTEPNTAPHFSQAAQLRKMLSAMEGKTRGKA